jgi:anti-anti-sigma factor
MSVLFSQNNDVLIIIPDERMDSNNSPDADEEIMKRIDRGNYKIVVDFSKTKYISSAGIRVIIRATKRVRRENGDIRLCGANEQILEVFEVTGLLAILTFDNNLEDAIGSFSSLA